MKVSLAILALLGYVQAVNIKADIGMGEGTDLSELAGVDAYSEANRFYNAKGEAIILSQTQGHARIELTKVQTNNFTPASKQLLQRHDDSESGAEDVRKKCTSSQLAADPNHCPLNIDGTPSQVHLYQTNLEDNAYISEVFVGNPPQKIRALFDTGSTNTWILNKAVTLQGNAEKEYSYDDSSSCTAVKLTQRAAIQFGSGALAGHFMTDDLRVGTCDSSSSG